MYIHTPLQAPCLIEGLACKQRQLSRLNAQHIFSSSAPSLSGDYHSMAGTSARKSISANNGSPAGILRIIREAMEQPTSLYQDQFPYFVNNEGRQNPEAYSEQGGNISAEAGGSDFQRAVYYGSIHPLALHDPESRQVPRAQDATFNLVPGMPVNQQLPAQRYSPGSLVFGAPEARYDLQTPPFHNEYIVDTHGSYNSGTQPRPSSSFPNYLDGPRPIEARALTSSITSPSGVPPGSSSSATLSPISQPLGHPTHDSFSSPLATYSRHDLAANQNLGELTPSPRGQYLSMSNRHMNTPSTMYSNYPNSMDMDGASTSSRGGTEALPFQDTKRTMELIDRQQRAVHPEIHAKIDKGFFIAHDDWTCYRRNYFAVACSYKLKLETVGDASGPMYLRNKPGHQIEKFAINIAACIDNDESKPIELVQHTPKRDKGPQTTPEKKILNANPTGQLGVIASSSMGVYPPSSPFSSHHQETSYYAAAPVNSPPPPPPADEYQSTTYERIQFKKATANNGKRRAAQQYFFIMVELYAGFRKASVTHKASPSVSDFDWHKVAVRMSAQMVVRGRSPGHYSDPTTRPNSSMGPGDGPSSYYTMGQPGASAMGGPAYMGSSSRMHSSGYSHGATASYSNRGMMQMSEGLELVPSLSSCSTLDDSSVSGDGNATMSTQSPYMYGNGMSHVPALMSPAFSLPPTTTGFGTPRPQTMSTNPFYDKLPAAPQTDYKHDPRWQRRADYGQMYSSQRYSGNMSTPQGYLNGNDPLHTVLTGTTDRLR